MVHFGAAIVTNRHHSNKTLVVSDVPKMAATEDDRRSTLFVSVVPVRTGRTPPPLERHVYESPLIQNERLKTTKGSLET
jgi:hypothetical protein